MDLNNFDKDLMRKIRDHKVELDKDQLWKGIENKRRKKKSRLLFIPLLFLLAASAYFFTAYDKSVDVLNDTAFQEESKFVKPEEKNGTTEEEYAIATTEKSIQLNSTDENNVETKNAENAKAQIETFKSSIEDDYNYAVIKEVQEAKAFLKPSEITNNTKSTIKDIRISKTITQTLGTHSEEIVHKKNPQKADIANSILEKKTNFPALLQIAVIKRLSPRVLFSDVYYITPDIVENRIPIQVVAKKNPFAISFYSSYGLVSRELENKSGNEVLDFYLNERNTSESVLDEFSAGFGVQYYFNKDWYLQSGVEFAQITERFLYTEEIVNPVTSQGTILQIIGPDPNMVQNIEGPLTGTQTIRDNYHYYNSYRFLDVPLILGYRKSYNKFSIGLEAGTLANMRLKFDGDLYNEEIEVSKGEELFKNRISIRYMIGTKMGFAFNNNITIFSKPSFVFGSNGVNAEINPLAQNYKIIRLQMGIDYKF